ncbi:hypothetical protein RJ639_014580, partial [Escallonia herrerae]
GIILVLLYVDDMIIIGSDLDGISILKQDINHHFAMKDLSTLSCFLGLEASTASDGCYLSQAKYASDLLSRANLTNSKTASIPLEPNVQFTPFDAETIEKVAIKSPIPTLCRGEIPESLLDISKTLPKLLQVLQFYKSPTTEEPKDKPKVPVQLINPTVIAAAETPKPTSIPECVCTQTSKMSREREREREKLTESSTSPKMNMVAKLPRYESDRKPPSKERRKTVPTKFVTMLADFDRGKCISTKT